MARPPKKGLSYFPMDVGFFEDDRVFALADRWGVKGIAVYLALLVTVYREGYYIEAPVERVAAMIMRSVGARSFTGQREVTGIMAACAEIGLLDGELFRQGIITSRGIQLRYAEVTARRSVKPDRYWLLDIPASEKPAAPQEDELPIPTAEPAIPATKPIIPATETSISAAEIPVSTAETPIPADKTPQNPSESSPKADHLISAAETPPTAKSTLPSKPVEATIPTTKPIILAAETAIPTAKTSIPSTEPSIPTEETPISADETTPNPSELSPKADHLISAAETPPTTKSTLPPKPAEPAAPEVAKAIPETKTSVSAAKTPVSAAETRVSDNRNATNQIKENQIKQNQTKLNEIKSDQIKSSRADSLPQGMMDDDGMDRIRKEFESIKILTPGDCRVMADLRRIYGLERVLDAIGRARSWGGKSVSYVRQILANDQNRTPSSFMSVSSAERRAATLRAAATAGGEIFSGMELIGRPISEEDAVLDADWLSDLTPEEAEAFFDRK